MEKLFLDSKNGRVCVVHEDAGGDSVVILAHGYLSDKNSGTNTELSKRFRELKISTIAFDVYGHGESEGDIEHLTVSKAVESMLAAYDFAASRYKRIGLVGSSFTGSVTLICASKRSPSAIALKCPVFMPKELWDWRFGDDGIRRWETQGYIDPFGKKWAYEAYEDAKTLDMRKTASGINAPTLVVHGDKDDTVPMSQAENLVFSLASEKRLLVIGGADHFFKDERHFAMMANAIAEWMADHLA